MNRSGLRTVFISRDNREVVMAFADATLAGVELATGRPLWSSRWSGGTFERSFDVSPDGSTYFAILAAGQLVAVGADGRTRWSVPLTWRQGREFVGFPLFVAAAPDGTVVAVTAVDGGVRVLDAATGDERAVLGGHDGRVAEIALSADGGLCASASSLGHVRVHDLSTGEDVWLFALVGVPPRPRGGEELLRQRRDPTLEPQERSRGAAAFRALACVGGARQPRRRTGVPLGRPGGGALGLRLAPAGAVVAPDTGRR
nr:PQQ-binding-like beta-propeller repeat protein [Deltaproteobacteria bacterium]